MIPRPYQQELVSRTIKALEGRDNTLAVSPTGSGKTLIISWLLKELGGLFAAFLLVQGFYRKDGFRR